MFLPDGSYNPPLIVAAEAEPQHEVVSADQDGGIADPGEQW